MPNVDQLKAKMPSIKGNLTGMIMGEDPLPIDPASVAAPSIWDRVQWSRVGFELPNGITSDEWQSVAEMVISADNGMQWLIGDIIRCYREEWGWGNMYDVASEMFPRYKEKALRNMVYVASNIQLSLRKDNLSWTHHMVVASCTDAQQSEYLQYASEHPMSVSEFKDYVRGKQSRKPSRQLPRPLTKEEDVFYSDVRTVLACLRIDDGRVNAKLVEKIEAFCQRLRDEGKVFTPEPKR